MKIAFILFNDMTLMDFAGVYEPIYRLNSLLDEEFELDLCSLSSPVMDYSKRVSINIPKIGESLERYDMIIVPGGFGTRELMHNDTFIGWLKTVKKECKIVSVCSGALLLGAAGFLKGKRATTHRNAASMLEKYCKEVSDERIVEDGSVITARGVTSSIDLGLYLCKKLGSAEMKEKIAKQMDVLLTGE